MDKLTIDAQRGGRQSQNKTGQWSVGMTIRRKIDSWEGVIAAIHDDDNIDIAWQGPEGEAGLGTIQVLTRAWLDEHCEPLTDKEE